MARQNLTSSLQMSARARKFMAMAAPGGTISQFRTAAVNRELQAAKSATEMSRNVFASNSMIKRPLAPPRTGRPTTDGTFRTLLNWEPDHRKNSVVFDTAQIRSRAPYYLIQEIGTGQSARILNPPGVLTVPSQRGRLISANLQWAPGAGAAPSRPGRGGALEQLYLVTDLNNATRRTRRMRIRREIKGKHFLRDGGIEGFRILSEGLKADARRIFQ